MPVIVEEGTRVPSDLRLRVKSLESLLVETRTLRVRSVSTSTLSVSATELWGDGASRRDSVHLDLWDDYLERA